MKQNSKTVSPMSNEGRNTYVIEHITTALFELLNEKSFDAVTISELTDRAGVGRASFYRNYTHKEDILRSHINKLFGQWKVEWESKEAEPLSEQIRTMIAHFEEHRTFYTMLNNQNLTYLLKDALISLCGPKPEQSMIEAYASAFAAYALYGWIETWFQRGMRESADEIADMFKAQGL